jgi:hypothetical protein
MMMNGEVGIVEGEGTAAPRNPTECWIIGVLGFPIPPTLHYSIPLRARSNLVKASQSQSKCFPNVTIGPQFQPQSLHIVVSPATHTANCASLLRHAPIQPCNSRFPSNPVKAGQTNQQSAIRMENGTAKNAENAEYESRFQIVSFPPISTWFHLIPPNSTSRHPGQPKRIRANRAQSCPIALFSRAST